MNTLLSFVDISGLAFLVSSSFLPVLSTRGIQKKEIKLGLQRCVIPIGIMCSSFALILILSDMSNPSTLWGQVLRAALAALYGLVVYVMLRIIPDQKGVFDWEVTVHPSVLGSTILCLIAFSFFTYYGESGWFDLTVFFFMGFGVSLSTLLAHVKNPTVPKSYLVVRQSAICAGLAMLYSLAAMWMYLDDPTMIGPYMSLGLISGFYASFLMAWSSLLIPNSYENRLYTIQIRFLSTAAISSFLFFVLMEASMGFYFWS